MSYFDDWHDWARLITFFVCSTCLFVLLLRYRQNRKKWNMKTRDYWYSLVMWCLAGCVIAIEGIYRNSDFSPRSVFVIAASCVTLKGLAQKGEWGEPKPKD